ncbi:exonuclease subunit SbcD [Myroides sp. WP-1]|uniref:metallophosphoesterase family protein n=1 Tax=Myroides sp. WP-1 TaxID=2759944 RepID=UPI0015F94D97|nr:exonuclease subunit SbcD [Myroides sp. WP-1]MBB1140778.1 exonuclease subunit SbcD [Myroides sp. WP-1]
MKVKILHTADWHLGKRLDNFSRIEEQRAVLDEICVLAEEQQADIIVIAGDLFDAFNPPTEAEDLFYRTLRRLTQNGCRPVLAIAGNHDSPERIDAPDPLARASGILLIGLPNTVVQPLEDNEYYTLTKSVEGFVELQLAHIPFPIRIIHTPYANEVRLKKALNVADKTTALSEVLQSNWEHLAQEFCDEQGVNMLVSHLYMMKKGGEELEEPDGEKPLKIGNADLIYSDSIPAQIQYTALGHLHRAHQIGEAERPVVYAGSPLCYSFSEAGQEKYVMLVEMEPNIPATYQKITLTKGRPLTRKKFDNVEDAVNWLQQHPHHLVELTLVSETFLKADDMKRIYQAHDGIITVIPLVNLTNPDATKKHQVNLEQDIQGLFVDYFKQKNNGQEPNEEVMDLFKEIIN